MKVSTLIAIVLMIFTPMVLIGALNLLLDSSIPLDLKHWFAAFLLILLARFELQGP